MSYLRRLKNFDKNQKFIKKLSTTEQNKCISTIEKILAGKIDNLDIKKLVGHQDLFRARVGSIRIIFISNRHENTILEISRRSDTTYNDF
jgi:mRNA-degrading endonuclease RelE of RelBE toxin-antitoxin system